MAQIQKVLKDALQVENNKIMQGYFDDTERALDEVKLAIEKVLSGVEYVELQPQPPHIRKLQHELAEQHNLSSKSVGDGSDRHLKIVNENLA
jgi:predicted RNA-binding protein Jag